MQEERTTTTVLKALEAELIKKSLMVRYEPPHWDADAERMDYLEVACHNWKAGFYWHFKIYCIDGDIQIDRNMSADNINPLCLRFQLVDPKSIEQVITTIVELVKEEEITMLGG